MTTNNYLLIGIIGFVIAIPASILIQMLLPFPYGLIMSILHFIVSGIFLRQGLKRRSNMHNSISEKDNQNTTVYCSKCGNGMSSDNQFCTKCGVQKK